MDQKNRAPKPKSVLKIGKFSPKNDFLQDLTKYSFGECSPCLTVNGDITFWECHETFPILNTVYLEKGFSARCPMIYLFLSFTFGSKNNNILQLGTMLHSEGIVLKSFFQIFSIVGR
jgi:hypothetical protein